MSTSSSKRVHEEVRLCFLLSSRQKRILEFQTSRKKYNWSALQSRRKCPPGAKVSSLNRWKWLSWIFGEGSRGLHGGLKSFQDYLPWIIAARPISLRSYEHLGTPGVQLLIEPLAYIVEVQSIGIAGCPPRRQSQRLECVAFFVQNWFWYSDGAGRFNPSLLANCSGRCCKMPGVSRRRRLQDLHTCNLINSQQT